MGFGPGGKPLPLPFSRILGGWADRVSVLQTLHRVFLAVIGNAAAAGFPTVPCSLVALPPRLGHQPRNMDFKRTVFGGLELMKWMG
jgi:hypothetical protein